jgi:hypothetical protein
MRVSEVADLLSQTNRCKTRSRHAARNHVHDVSGTGGTSVRRRLAGDHRLRRASRVFLIASVENFSKVAAHFDVRRKQPHAQVDDREVPETERDGRERNERHPPEPHGVSRQGNSATDDSTKRPHIAETHHQFAPARRTQNFFLGGITARCETVRPPQGTRRKLRLAGGAGQARHPREPFEQHAVRNDRKMAGRPNRMRDDRIEPLSMSMHGVGSVVESRLQLLSEVQRRVSKRRDRSSLAAHRVLLQLPG